MRRPLIALACALLVSTPALAEPDWSEAAEYEVRLSPWSYEPSPIRLEAGKPVRLHLLNYSQVGQHFSAARFFAAAQIQPEDDEVLRGGGIKVAPGEQRTITLVPAPGRYRVRSANVLHRLLGMSAQIIVE